MKIYEFRCEDCGSIFELSDSKIEELLCRNCGSRNVKRVYCAPALLKENSAYDGKTCCGRDERCDMPPCGENGTCIR